MKDLSKYPGSKNGSGVYQNIINVFPKHDIYIEAFLGSAAILKKKVTAAINIGIDLDSSLAKFYDAGHGFEFVNANSISFLKAAVPLLNMLHAAGQKVLCYCDPPYVISSRRSANVLYKKEMSDQDHIEFINAMVPAKFYVVISSYRSPLYDDILLPAGWNSKNFDTITHKGKATETIYYNFPSDLPKHEYTYVGNNFRERAAAKGRVFRNLSKINAMQLDEKNWLISELLKHQ
jgi:hypothetical protein